ncbi:hypothetical protein Glove_13g270 [Diversispora epigaea]|uniref:Uncharacterized protein n=1 Tax=Diversispora epigaea TaxID=1348612 RepID=A0A397JXB0_9GLOM|nr:hypothetical protein Glove_13g270 [Diversispora epigaea]
MDEVKYGIISSSGGIAQNPTLPTNLEGWSKEDFLTLKTTSKTISTISIFQIPILLINKISFGLPPHIEVLKEPFSAIISKEHAAEISNWIDRETINYSTTNIPYKFELILSGTRDEFAPQAFAMVMLKTAVVAKIKGTDEIFRGYNPLARDNTCDNARMEHAAEISNWIDRETINYSTTNIPYKFELILSGTRDEFAPQAFAMVMLKTAVVAKIKGTDEIFRGYNPLARDNTCDNARMG